MPVISDNFISELRKEDLQTLATSLKNLDLSGNSLTSVPEGIFWDLQRLETLDLSRNNIIQIHSMAFQNGVSMILFFTLATDHNSSINIQAKPMLFIQIIIYYFLTGDSIISSQFS